MLWNACGFMELVKHRHLPKSWAPMLPGREIQLVDVDEGTDEYKEVCGRFENENLPKVKGLQRIQNPYLWGCYLSKKEEFKPLDQTDNEVILYHETSEGYVESIVQDNFDWRLYRNTMFGKGVSFSASAKFAHARGNNKGVMFVTLMLRGRCSAWHKDCDLPPLEYDTTTSGAPNHKVVVGFNDNDFYPQYVVYWEMDDKQDAGEDSTTTASLAYPG